MVIVLSSRSRLLSVSCLCFFTGTPASCVIPFDHLRSHHTALEAFEVKLPVGSDALMQRRSFSLFCLYRLRPLYCLSLPPGMQQKEVMRHKVL
jgi:hypothetical protein